MKRRLFQALLLGGLIIALAQVHWREAESNNIASYQFDTFSEYVSYTKTWLNDHRRSTALGDHHAEVLANSPFELQPEGEIKGAILLVHGLGDSPFTFKEFATTLIKKGFVVRALLLPGHGSHPIDMRNASVDDWMSTVEYHSALLLQEYDNVWLGGFSTGANLVAREAYLNDKVQGLLLFSPGFKPHSPLVRFSSFISTFKTWAIDEPELNPVRYTSQTFHGGAEYYKSAKAIQALLESGVYSKPTYMVLSEDDTVIDPDYAIERFNDTFTHPKSHLLWYGENELLPSSPRVTSTAIRSQEHQISTGSHMFPLFSMNNQHYGTQSPFRLCRNGQSEENAIKCKDKNEAVWYSGYGYREEGKVHARLTFNPHYKAMTHSIGHFLSSNLE